MSSEEVYINELVNEFQEHRKAIKAKMTDRALVLFKSKLIKLRDEGHDLRQMVDDAIMNGWKSIYPVQSNGVSKGIVSNTSTPMYRGKGLNPQFIEEQAYEQFRSGHK